MPIFDQGYQHWDGQLSGQFGRILAIVSRGVQVQIRNRWVRWIMLAALGPAFLLSVFLVIWGLFESKSSLLTPFFGLLKNLPEELQAGPKAFRIAVWTLAVRQFFELQIFFSMMLVLLIGPDLISQDLRFNALPLYLSRPIRRWEYFVGKLGVIAVFLSAVTLLPVLVAFLLGFGFSLDASVIRDTGLLFLGSLAYGVVVVFSAGLLMLAFSSMSRNSRYVGATWLVFWLVSGVSAQVLKETVNRDWCPLASYTRNLLRIRDSLIGAHAAWGQIERLTEAGRDTFDAMASGPFLRGRRGLGPPLPPMSRRAPRPQFQSPIMAAFIPPTFPWWWSASVLCGLAVLSIGVLATRVRGLDRLN